ncbi:MAG TPA: hypothetical protein VD704_07345 [Gaiellaceae bacterium]|nr:hypothetical protein [Gaiellaceae bacterium]
MDAAPAHELPGRGAPRLLEDFAVFERLTAAEGPSGRLRLEHEVGWELAQLLVSGLSRARAVKPEPVPA